MNRRRQIVATLLTQSLVVALAFAAAGPAAADANLNCSAYAGMAVADNEQNKALGCGFQGPQWHSDFNAHFQWCQLPATKMENLTNEDKARKAALQLCALKPYADQSACHGYAEQAVAQNAEAVAMNCGLTSKRWSADYAAHFNWCLKADAASRSSVARARAARARTSSPAAARPTRSRRRTNATHTPPSHLPKRAPASGARADLPAGVGVNTGPATIRGA
jgi:hypothetical protein